MTAPEQIRPPSGAERLRAIADGLRANEPSPTPTVREFLSWFGAMRRGQFVVRRLRSVLKRFDLNTSPDFEGAFIDARISFVPAPVTVQLAGTAFGTPVVVVAPLQTTSPLLQDETPISIGIGDPTYRIGRLAAANNNPTLVAPDRPVVDAVTLMLSNDFSQLPVMTNERTVKGMISWRSIGARWALDRDEQEVRHFMDEHVEIPGERSIFAALPLIVEHGYVLVRDETARISGIVTTSDLSLQFQQLAEPFLLLGEIENHIRRLMDGKFTKEELAGAKDPDDEEREIENVADLTFGEYVRILQEPAMWLKLGLAIDRAIFVKDLDRVREIRNDVMHFDPDPLPEADLAALRRFVKFLQALQSLGV
jgi:CBS domain-containing protein